MKVAVIVALLCLVGCTYSQVLSLLLLNGCFKYINDTKILTGESSYNNGPRGSVTYVPAFPGASYGNVSVDFGEEPNGTSSDALLASFVSYAGGYQVDLVNGIVHHYPVISSSPLVVVGSDVIRWFQFFDNGNMLNLKTDPASSSGESTLFWQRVFPLPFTTACAAEVSLVPRTGQGSYWMTGMVANQIFDVEIANSAVSTINFMNIRIVPGPNVTVTQAWNLTGGQLSDGIFMYSVSNPHAGFAVGGRSTATGFIVSGTPPLLPQISVYSIAC